MIDIGILHSALREGREAAADRMHAGSISSVADLWRKAGLGVQDEATGLQPTNWAQTYASLPMRLAGAAADTARYSTVTVVEGVTYDQAVRTAHLPYDTNDLADGDLIHIVAGENAGTWWEIQEVGWQDQSTARRVPVKETRAPKELAGDEGGDEGGEGS